MMAETSLRCGGGLFRVESTPRGTSAGREPSVQTTKAPLLLALFQVRDFLQPSCVTLLAGKASSQKRFEHLPSQGVAKHLPTQTDHVHVIMFDTLMRRVVIGARARPHPGDLVSGDAGPNAAPTNGDPTFNCPLRDSLRQRTNEIRV